MIVVVIQVGQMCRMCCEAPEYHTTCLESWNHLLATNLSANSDWNIATRGMPTDAIIHTCCGPNDCQVEGKGCWGGKGDWTPWFRSRVPKALGHAARRWPFARNWSSNRVDPLASHEMFLCAVRLDWHVVGKLIIYWALKKS